MGLQKKWKKPKALAKSYFKKNYFFENDLPNPS
jgi:hypothetical protein